MELRRLLLVVVLPGAVCLLVLLAGWRPWKRTRPSAGRCRWSCAAGFGAGVLTGVLVVMGRWPPLHATSSGDWLALRVSRGEEWLAVLVCVASATGLLEALFRLPRVVRWLVRGALCVVSVELLLQSMVLGVWSGWAHVAWVGGLAGGLFASWTSMERLAERSDGALLPLSWWLASAGLSVGLLVVGKAERLGELGGVLAACLIGAAIAGVWRRDLTLARGAVPVVAIMHGGLLLTGHFHLYGFGIAVTLLLALAPHGAWIGQARGVRRGRAWKRMLLVLGVVLVLVNTALALGLWLSRTGVGSGGGPF